MSKYNFLLVIIFQFTYHSILCQEFPAFENYSPQDYDAENQNWSLSQHANGHLYIANNSGLLTYNGAQWQHYKSPNQTIIRAVKAVIGESEAVEPPVYDNLVWADEFDEPGAPNPENWNYDLGTGQAGWGNNESQYYTDRPENILIEDGLLKITAQRESYMRSDFTSARIKTDGLQEFTYGRMEIRAKLPQGGGTWPAIWMLGANFSEVSWPASGEIDIMEHVGNEPTTILSTLHYQGNFGINGPTQEIEVPGVEEDFHVYRLIWGPDNLFFYVEDELYHTFDNQEDLPFNADFFFILNVAMGGNLGGAIDPNFSASQMEVDYVRVYQ